MDDKTNPHDMAFAVADHDGFAPGLTKREYFAAQMLPGLLGDTNISVETSAETAVAAADALIEALNNG